MLARWPKKNRPEVRSTAESAFCASIAPVDQPHRALADVAMAAGADSSPNMPSSTCRRQRARLAQRDEIVELGHLDALALVGRAALGDLAAAQLDVAGAVERERVGGQAVAAGAADLLVIGLDRRRHVGVEDEAHVRLVDRPCRRRSSRR